MTYIGRRKQIRAEIGQTKVKTMLAKAALPRITTDQMTRPMKSRQLAMAGDFGSTRVPYWSRRWSVSSYSYVPKDGIQYDRSAIVTYP